MWTDQQDFVDAFVQRLRARITDFGDRPSYILFEEELEAGESLSLFDSIEGPFDKGDGTSMWKVVFEGTLFQCVTENKS